VAACIKCSTSNKTSSSNDRLSENVVENSKRTLVLSPTSTGGKGYRDSESGSCVQYGGGSQGDVIRVRSAGALRTVSWRIRETEIADRNLCRPERMPRIQERKGQHLRRLAPGRTPGSWASPAHSDGLERSEHEYSRYKLLLRVVSDEQVVIAKQI
jgi:hypothetical protein